MFFWIWKPNSNEFVGLIGLENDKPYFELSEKNLDLKKLEEKIKLFRITKSVDDQDDGNNKASRKKINEYVREIDKCIALLNE